MTTRRRVQTIVLALAMIVLLSNVELWGDSGGKSRDKTFDGGSRTVPARPASAAPSSDDLAMTKFAGGDVVVYTALNGEHYFGLQVKPKLDPIASHGSDILVLVDTSASQVGLPLRLARELADQIVAQAGVKDRIAVWTVNTPAATHELTRGFKAARSMEVHQALTALREEIPLGNTDLKNGLERAIKLFEAEERDGPQAILFLGDGFSTYNPISSSDRARLCDRMVASKVAFYPVPLGPMLDSANLHGFATGTGGLVLRWSPKDKAVDIGKRVLAAINAPVLYPSDFKLAVKEYFPAKLPPLRADAPTLVVGKFEPVKKLVYEVAGHVAGRQVRIAMSENVAEPEPDNFFLATMVQQWKKDGDRPALMRADRALAFAQQVNLNARDELLGQAQMALLLDERPAAQKLFEQVRKLDPIDPEAKGGLALINALNEGKVKREDLRRQLDQRAGRALLIEKASGKQAGKARFRRDEMRHLLALASEAPAAGAPLAPAEREDLQRHAKAKQAIEEQRINRTVDEALRQARQLVRTDPEAAVDLLKRTVSALRDNTDLRPDLRAGLLGRLEPALRNVTTDAIRLRRDREEQLVFLAQAEQRAQSASQQLQDQERTRERLRRYRTLMNQARLEDAFLEGLALAQDAVNEGKPVSVAATAAANIGLAAHNLREIQELNRVRRERYLATMLQVEKSHIPFPDEPPVQFPPAAQWKRLTALRKDRYENSGLTDDDPQTLAKLKELKTKMETGVTLDGFEPNTPLKEALGFLTERYGITILMDTEAFKADLQIMEPDNQPVKLPRMVNVRLETVLRLLLAQASATFIIRRDYVEVTTPQRQAAEKTIRVYPVGDLVTPIPNSVNQQAVNQTMQNSLLGFGGGFGGFAGFAGGFNGFPGTGFPGFGAAGFNGFGFAGGFNGFGFAGGFNGFGAPGVGLGGGFNGLGVAGGFNGFGIAGGFNGLGFGVLGSGLAQGGGAGGNLGGQFGLQGGDTSALLIRLVTQVVGKPEDWTPIPAGVNGNGIGGGGFAAVGMLGMFGGMMMGIPPADPNDGYGNPNEAGALGYYAPTRALIVKGTSRIHTRLGGGLLAPRQPAAAAGAGALLIEPGKKPVHVAGATDRRGDKAPAKTGKDRKTKPSELADLDPKKVWQATLAQAHFEPGMIIATADFLVERGKFEHSAEFLKADLRNAVVVRPWVYEALALSLRLGKGSLEEIERAELSAIDLEPSGADGYLRASRVMAENKRWERAVAFCRQASLLSPDSPRPYADALRYAREARDVDAMEWASGNLLKLDWPVHNDRLHTQARDELKHLKQILEKEKGDAANLQRLESAHDHLQRDLVVTLTWQGQADLDLKVKEPIGTVCSFQQRQTPAGGTLLGDNIKEANRSKYVVSEGFSGNYEITIQRVWGKPQGAKATLHVVVHEGTPQERIVLRETIFMDFEKQSPVRNVNLTNGRRTSLTEVSLARALADADDYKAKRGSGDQVLNQLRLLADHDLTESGGVRGGFGDLPPISTRQSHAVSAASKAPSFQGKAASLVPGGVEMTYRPIVAPDGKVVGTTLHPVFQTLDHARASPTVLNPVIPGGR
jgi:hypothetical protein